MSDFVNNSERAFPPGCKPPGTGHGIWVKILLRDWTESGVFGLGNNEAQ